jgi:hypothetical protein
MGGSIQMTEIRHEPSYMQLVGEHMAKKDFIRIVRMYLNTKYTSNFIKYTCGAALFSMYKEVGFISRRVHLIKSKTTFTYSFEKVVNIPIYIKPKITQMILKIIMHSLQINQIDILG